eukprot:COSAG03_NODE_210_length_10594_cov_32.990472_2_plen_142_part_00
MLPCSQPSTSCCLGVWRRLSAPVSTLACIAWHGNPRSDAIFASYFDSTPQTNCIRRRRRGFQVPDKQSYRARSRTRSPTGTVLQPNGLPSRGTNQLDLHPAQVPPQPAAAAPSMAASSSSRFRSIFVSRSSTYRMSKPHRP